MTFATHKEFRAAVKKNLEAGRFTETAAIILENPEATSDYWLDWAFKVRAGILNPETNGAADIPLVKKGDLFDEAVPAIEIDGAVETATDVLGRLRRKTF